MIKEKLKKALSDVVEEYNGGTDVNAAIAKVAAAYDFNKDQSDRLCELFNTAAAINKEKDSVDPTGTCELASKEAVAKLLLEGDNQIAKAASVKDCVDASQYDFYASIPCKNNTIMNARKSGSVSMLKAASADGAIPDELDVSQRSLYKMIRDNIGILKSAGDAADDIVRQLQLEADRMAVKIAKTIEHPFADAEMADMFKAACEHKKAVEIVSEYSTKVAESSGGRFANAAVFDSSKVDELLKMAGELEGFVDQVHVYEGKRDHYMAKAAEADESLKRILGLMPEEHRASMADFFANAPVKKAGANDGEDKISESPNDNEMSKIAELIRKSGVKSEVVEKLAEDIEKSAGPTMLQPRLNFSASDMLGAMSGKESMPGMNQRVLNEYRRMLLDDLMTNDPIIRDADPNTVAELYKSIVMSAPRLSLDPTVVRSVLRSGVNSVAISPNDIKTLTDVDKGMALANVERLTALDSSIKDSNMV